MLRIKSLNIMRNVREKIQVPDRNFRFWGMKSSLGIYVDVI